MIFQLVLSMKFTSNKCQKPILLAACMTGLLAFIGCKPGSDQEARDNSALTPELSHQAMIEQVAHIAVQSKTHNPYFGDGRRSQLLSQVERAKGNASAGVLLSLGSAELNLGMEKEAIRHMEQALRVVSDDDKSGPKRSDVLYWLGVANLRLAETENCCAQNTPDSCIIPIQGSGIHSRPEGSRKAIAYLTEVLQLTSRNSETNVRARWLLNIAYMTLGEYPTGVPFAYRVDPDYFKSKVTFPRFKNVSK